MNRIKRNNGIITIEASIAIAWFMFIILFVLSFGSVYRAQNIVSHATLQTSQGLAIESYFRETLSDSDSHSGAVLFFTRTILGMVDVDVSDITDLYTSLGSTSNFKNIIKKRFAYSIANSEDEADKLLKNVGIKNGLDGINFSDSCIIGNDIIVIAKYSVKLQFSFFGANELLLSKAAKSKSFKNM